MKDNNLIWDEPIADENLDKVVYDDETIYYYKNNRSHRQNGPAGIYPNGEKIWCQNGLCHRLDGPAHEFVNGYKYWYYKGERIDCSSQQEFEKLLKLKAFW